MSSDKFFTNRAATTRLALFAVLVCALVAAPLLSHARVRATSITVVNNSSLEFRHLYLSSVSDDNWGADQLNDSVIASGQSFTLEGVSCGGSQIKVIVEDQNGCFLSGVVSCASNAVWTIASNASPDCGQ